MKEKYYVRLVSPTEEFPDEFVFGLSHEKKSGVTVVGGPSVMKEKILEVVRDAFGKSFGVEHNHGRRFVAVANRISVKRWGEGFATLSESFAITPTRRFRRLMR